MTVSASTDKRSLGKNRVNKEKTFLNHIKTKHLPPLLFNSNMLAVNFIEEKLSPRHHHTKMTASKDLKKNKSIKIITQQFTDIFKGP